MTEMTQKDRDRIDRVYKREMELIKQGKDPDTAHAIAVAEDTLPELDALKKSEELRQRD
jgi:hypothetical protein